MLKSLAQLMRSWIASPISLVNYFFFIVRFHNQVSKSTVIKILNNNHRIHAFCHNQEIANCVIGLVTDIVRQQAWHQDG